MRNALISLAVLVAADVLIGRLDLDATEPQPAAAMILVLAAVLTWRTPSLAALWIAGSAASIPLSYIAAPALGIVPRDPPAHLWTTAVALVPAALGTAIGLGVRALRAER
jgi:hypothetical protein